MRDTRLPCRAQHVDAYVGHGGDCYASAWHTHGQTLQHRMRCAPCRLHADAAVASKAQGDLDAALAAAMQQEEDERLAAAAAAAAVADAVPLGTSGAGAGAGGAGRPGVGGSNPATNASAPGVAGRGPAAAAGQLATTRGAGSSSYPEDGNEVLCKLCGQWVPLGELASHELVHKVSQLFIHYYSNNKVSLHLLCVLANGIKRVTRSS